MIGTAQAFGIDIGGSGIKAAPVDLVRGAFAENRLKIPTPVHSSPQAVATVVDQELDHFQIPKGVPVGITFPAPIKPGRPIEFIANLDRSWLGVDVDKVLTEACERPIIVINDADAAGLAEVQFGSAKGQRGLVIATTLGTGIGSALIFNGELIPNTELGHIELNGGDAEKWAAASVKTREHLDYKTWAQQRLTPYYRALELYLSPDLFVVGGGVSRQSELFLPYIDVKTPLVAAKLHNEAGIVGAAYYASAHRDEA